MKSESIKAKLKNIAVREGKQLDYLLTLYTIERLLYRVSISKYADQFVLKGGLLLYTILDEKARATKDIDILARQINNTLENISAIFVEVCSIEIDDALRFDLTTITVERIKEDADYKGVRVKITVFLDHTKKVLQLDIGFGDVVVPQAVQMEYPSLLNMEKPKIKAYSMESVISEKFEAMVYLAEVNSRMKDFYDIYSLSEIYDFKGIILKKAVESTFVRRGTLMPHSPTVFTLDFQNSTEKNQQWNSFKRRIASKNDLEFTSIIERIKDFLEPIYYSIQINTIFEKCWDANQGEWR